MFKIRGNVCLIIYFMGNDEIHLCTLWGMVKLICLLFDLTCSE